MVRFSFLAYLRALWRSFFPPSSDDLTYDEIYADWDIRQLEHQHQCEHLERCFKRRAVEEARADSEP